MEENGVLYRLRKKWWTIIEESPDSHVKEVQIHHVASVFFLLLIGVGIAVAVFLCEVIAFKCKQFCVKNPGKQIAHRK